LASIVAMDKAIPVAPDGRFYRELALGVATGFTIRPEASSSLHHAADRMDIAQSPGVTCSYNSNKAWGTRWRWNGKESVMCYEFSEWSWKLRAAELARKERDAANAAKTQGGAVTPAQPAAPETRVEERESVPA